MKKLAVLLGVCATILVACTKEKSIEGGIQKSLLVKTVAKQGNDSLVYTYGYDNDARLTSYNTDVHLQGQVYQSHVTISRDNGGLVQQITNNDNQSGSTVYTLNYNTGNARYTSAITTHMVSGQSVKDSLAFTYNNSGQITKAEHFFDNGLSGGYAEGFKTEYTYDGDGNVIKATAYTYDPISGTYGQSGEGIYEYDTKVNPVKFGIEAYVLGEPERASGFNVTKATTTDILDPTQNQTVTSSYTYMDDDRPATATVVLQGVGLSFTSTYFYQ